MIARLLSLGWNVVTSAWFWKMVWAFLKEMRNRLGKKSGPNQIIVVNVVTFANVNFHRPLDE